MSAAKKIAMSVLIPVAIVLGTLVCLEGAASMYLFASDYRGAQPVASATRPFFAHDTLTGWTNKPGYFNANAFGSGISLSINSAGLRAPASVDSTSADSTSADSLRAALTQATSVPSNRAVLTCSGDSYTFGLGVADAKVWCARLAQSFPQFAVANLAAADFGLDQAVLRFEREHPASTAFHLLGITDSELETATAADLSGRAKPLMRVENNALVAQNVPVAEQSAAELRRWPARRRFEDLRLVMVFRKILRVDRSRSLAEAVDKSWPVYEKLIERVAATPASGSLVVVYLPIPRNRRPGPADGRRAQFAALAQKHRIDFVDLTPAYRALRPDSADLIFIVPPTGGSRPFSGQYSNMGHTWVAQNIAEHLRSVSIPAHPVAASPAPDK